METSYWTAHAGPIVSWRGIAIQVDPDSYAVLRAEIEEPEIFAEWWSTGIEATDANAKELAQATLRGSSSASVELLLALDREYEEWTFLRSRGELY